ncbi:MAG: RICIN domain-containing protein [Oscillospiraceae bacterium]|nr:RICIN domain-containing protein [Oscillospiraceae bacterium]
MKRIISVILVMAMLVSWVFTALPATEVVAAPANSTYEQSLLDAGFPQSYVTKLSALHELHPTWKFQPLLVTAQKPAYTWDYVIGKELESDQRNLIYHTYSPNAYALDSVLVESGLWYKCSRATVEFFMDPRNSLNEERIFQFEALEFTGNYTVSDVANCVKGSFMEGVTLENGRTYARNLFDIGKSVGVSPFHLAARIKQEQGLGKSPLISGTCGNTLAQCYARKTDGAPATGYNGHNFAQYNGYYNYFNIGAFGTGYFNIWLNGMKEAQTGGWTTRYKAILGGAQKVHDMYISQYQNTMYLQKFNVHPSSSKNFWGQYMQNVSAAWSESVTIFNAYRSSGLLDTAFTFIIPVFANMPASCPDPGGAFAAKSTAVAPAIPASLKSQVFDADYYRNAYPDLKDAYGADDEELYNHFVQYGIAEGRQAHPAFDIKYYLNENSDLKAAFGKDRKKAMDHFVTIGYKEGRDTAKPSDLGSVFYAKITSAKSGRVLTVNGTDVVIYDANSDQAQIWQFVRQSDGSYKIINMKDGKSVLAVDNASSASETKVIIGVDLSKASAMRWHIYQNGSNFLLKPQCADLCALDVKNGGTTNGTGLQIYTVDGTPAQDFTVTKVEEPTEPPEASDVPQGDGITTTTEGSTGKCGVTISSEQKKLVFDAVYYANAHPDLKNAFGSDAAKLYAHFLNYGISEGRQAHPTFGVKYYLSQHSDLRDTFGTDYARAVKHYITIGYNENRKTAEPSDLGDVFYAKMSPSSVDNMNVTLSSGKTVISDPTSSLAQIWKFIRQTDGSYKIVNMKTGTKVLDGSDSTKGYVVIADSDESSDQRWFIYDKGATYIIKCASDKTDVLDLLDNKTGDNTKMVCSGVDGNKTQRWNITKTSQPNTDTGDTNSGSNTGTAPDTTPDTETENDAQAKPVAPVVVNYRVASPYNTNAIGTYTSYDTAKSVANSKVQYGYVVYDSNGKFVYTPATSLNASKILWNAKNAADHMRTHGFIYGNATKNQYYNKSEKIVSCDRFVGWALGDAGYVAGQPATSGLNLYGHSNDLGYGCLETFLKQHGFTKITDINQVKAGDIIFVGYSTVHTTLSATMRQYPQHVFIAASGYREGGGQAYRYDAGSNSRIRSVQPTYEPLNYASNLFRFAYRAPATGNNSPAPSGPSGSTNRSGLELTAFQKNLVFDAVYYSNKYPDLKNAFGSDSTKLYDHFLNFGVLEGRQAHPVFSVTYYLSQSSDLKNAFGTNYPKAIDHYVTLGYKEGRKTAEPADVGTNFTANIVTAKDTSMSLRANGTAVQLYANSTEPAQVWKFVRRSNGSYVITNMADTSKALDAGDTGINITVTANNDSKEQQWYLYEKNGTYVMKPASCQYAVMDLQSSSIASGTSAVRGEVNGSNTQRFKIVKASVSSGGSSTPAPSTSSTVTYRVASPYNTNCIGTYSSLSSAQSAANSKVQLGYVVYDSNGRFVYTPATSLNASKILWEAKGVADYQKAHGFVYGDSSVNPFYDKSQKIVSCDRFVGWALGNAGYVNGQPAVRGLPLPGHNLDLNYGSLETFLKLHGFTKITDINQVRAGDIVFVGYCTNHTYLAPQYRSYPQHVFIAASNYSPSNGQTYRYDAGSLARIRSNQPFYEPLNYASNPFRFAYRAPGSGNTGASSGGSTVTISSSQKSLVFDATYYANKYPDLKAAFGTDATKLYQHFVTYGISEGRQGCAAFSTKAYLQKYSDLKSAYGNDHVKALEHYLIYGYNEGRRAPA